jgi:hypothetical protein
MTKSFSLNWEGIEVTGSIQGQNPIHWCNDWANIDALVVEGYLRRIHRGPATYGHVDYYLSDLGMAAAEVKV